MPDPAGLVERLRAGDERAFEALVLTYQHRVFGVAVRMLGSRAEAEEVAQDVFLRVYRSIGEFRGEARLSTWLYSIAARLCLDRLRTAERRHPRAEPEALLNVPAAGAGADSALEAQERRAALHQAIADLPEERRIVVILRDVEGLSYEEIAEALDIELNTVRSRLHRARAHLKAKLERFLP